MLDNMAITTAQAESQEFSLAEPLQSSSHGSGQADFYGYAQEHLEQINLLINELEKGVLEHIDAREENDLLLAQLHQVQEELERVWLESKELQAKADKQVEFLRTKLDERDVLICQYQRALNQLKGVCLCSFQQSFFSWPRLLRAGKVSKSLSATTTVRAKATHKTKRGNN